MQIFFRKEVLLVFVLIQANVKCQQVFRKHILSVGVIVRNTMFHPPLLFYINTGAEGVDYHGSVNGYNIVCQIIIRINYTFTEHNTYLIFYNDQNG